uniref:basic salivary proline-rich protein 3-like n=1 Tax=Agelaius phoeniceus TaxID=39638 RepID=UPI0023ED94FA|nr:basic salivary proline-rich protein 3-like [Agelaius phoeniceus]
MPVPRTGDAGTEDGGCRYRRGKRSPTGSPLPVRTPPRLPPPRPAPPAPFPVPGGLSGARRVLPPPRPGRGRDPDGGDGGGKGSGRGPGAAAPPRGAVPAGNVSPPRQRAEQSGPGPRGKALREAGAGGEEEEEEEEGEEAREGARGKQEREELGAEPGSGRSAPVRGQPDTPAANTGPATPPRRHCASLSRWNSASRQTPSSPPPPPPAPAASGGVTAGPPAECPRMVQP